MKRLMPGLLLLPLLISCTIEDNYPNNYRRQPPPVAEVDRPASSFNHYHHRSSPPRYAHQHDESLHQTANQNMSTHQQESTADGETHTHYSEANNAIRHHDHD